MQVQLLVERDQNECIVKLAGTAYKFKRNEHGHLVAEISDLETIKWVSDPINTSFRLYVPPKKVLVAVDKVVDEAVRMSAHFGNEGDQDEFAPPASQSEPDPPSYPKKGSKKPKKEQG
jgi:hypothetical protein